MKSDETLTKITLWERCSDQWSKRDGRWAIDQRVSEIDFDEFREFLLCRGRWFQYGAATAATGSAVAVDSGQ